MLLLASWQPVPSLIRFVHVDITESRRRIRGNLAPLSPPSLAASFQIESRVRYPFRLFSSLASIIPSFVLYLFSRLLGFAV